MTDTSPSAYERRLMRAIEDIRSKMRELAADERALERQLMIARRENVSLSDVSRKNSANRVLVENRILEVLKEAPKPVTNTSLYREARNANYDLTDNTFRTHLHRLKKKGVIESAGRGLWRLPKVTG